MNKRVLLFFLIVSVLPFIRGCDGITIGFPAVSAELDPIYFNVIGAFINIIFLVIFSLLFIKFYRSRFYKRIFNGGIYLVLIYHFFWILIHLDIFDFDIEIWMWIMAPLYLPLAEIMSIGLMLPFIWPDDLDFTIRLSYLISVLLYFIIGSILYKIYLSFTVRNN